MQRQHSHAAAGPSGAAPPSPDERGQQHAPYANGAGAASGNIRGMSSQRQSPRNQQALAVEAAARTLFSSADVAGSEGGDAAGGAPPPDQQQLQQQQILADYLEQSRQRRGSRQKRQQQASEAAAEQLTAAIKGAASWEELQLLYESNEEAGLNHIHVVAMMQRLVQLYPHQQATQPLARRDLPELFAFGRLLVRHRGGCTHTRGGGGGPPTGWWVFRGGGGGG